VWSLVLGPMGAVLAVPLTLFFKCILFDTELRTRWMSVFLGGDLDDVVPTDPAPPSDTEPPGPAPTVPDEPDPEPRTDNGTDPAEVPAPAN